MGGDVASLKDRTRVGRKSIMTYPHPSFDLSSAFIPPSMKELYRWCLYLYMTHSEIKPILKKKVAYVQTPLIYNGTVNSKKVWKSLLPNRLLTHCSKLASSRLGQICARR